MWYIPYFSKLPYQGIVPKLDMQCTLTRTSVRSSGFLYIRALRKIRIGEELFMDFGDIHPINDDEHPETLSDMEDEGATAGASAADKEEENGDK